MDIISLSEKTDRFIEDVQKIQLVLMQVGLILTVLEFVLKVNI